MSRFAIVTGAQGSLGSLICHELGMNGFAVYPIGDDIDVTDKEEILDFRNKLFQSVAGATGAILVNCAGLESIAWLADLSEFEWDNVFGVNVKSHFLLTQALLPALAGGAVLNITSRAARFPMRCSAAYNASKAAADMLTRQMARELYTTQDTVVFGIAPNKLADTAMSKRVDEKVCKVRGWTMEKALAYERAGQVVKENTPPETVAEFIGFLLSQRSRHLHLNGCIINYGD